MVRAVSLWLCILLLTLSASAFAAFPDVPTGHVNGVAIDYLQRQGIIAGYPDGRFGPSLPINRAELLKILIEALGISPDMYTYQNCFPDVRTDWFARYVCYAKSQGWISGYPDGTFRPAQRVSDVEALKMLLEVRSMSVYATVYSDPFVDVRVGEWFTPYVARAKDLGLLEANETSFYPGKALNRANVAELIFRALSLSLTGQPTYTELVGQTAATLPFVRPGSVLPQASSSSSSVTVSSNASSESPVLVVSSSSVSSWSSSIALVQSSSSVSSVKSSASSQQAVSTLPGILTADATKSTVKFEGRKNGVTLHEGEFKEFTVSVTPDPAAPNDLTKAKINVEIRIPSIHTESSALTTHLLSADFFEADTYPVATFNSTRIVKLGSTYTVEGNLKIKNTTKAVSFGAVTFTSSALKFDYTLPRLDYGVGATGDGVESNVPLHFDIRLKE